MTAVYNQFKTTQEGQSHGYIPTRLTADIVIAHANMNELSSDDLLAELRAVYATLQRLQLGETEIATQEPMKRGRKAKEKPATLCTGTDPQRGSKRHLSRIRLPA